MDGEGVIALLPMKGHSERVPRKNLRLFAGRPLYRHCLTTLLSVPAVRAVVIDTDCDAIRADVGAAFAAELASGRVRLLSRPPGLCGGLVPMTEVLKHDVALLRELQGAAAPPAATQLCAWLQTHATNPLLRAATVEAALAALASAAGRRDSLFSVTRVRARLFTAGDGAAPAVPLNHDPAALLRTQDLAPVWAENSCLYLFTAEQLLRGGKRYGDAPLLFEMAAPEATDIDDEADWDTAAALAAAGFAAGPAPTPPPPPGGDDSRLMRLRPPGLGAPSPPQPPPPPVGSAGTVLVTAPYLRPCMARLSAVLASFGLAVLLPPPGAGGSEPDDRMGEERLLPLCGGFDAAIAGDDAWTAAVLAAAAPRLKVVAKWGTGVDGIDAPAAAALGVAVRRTPGAHTSAVADSVLAFTLAHARRMSDAQAAMRAGGWARDGRPVALRELAFGLVGFGGVGREVARRLAAFGATEVQFVDPVAPPPGWWAEQQEDGASACRCGRSAPPAHPAASLAALAAAADVLILACDLNPSSVKIVDGPLLAAMKPTAFLVNCARGGLVDEAALCAALAAGRLAGAGLDVYEVEPLPTASPLRRLPNVWLSAHNANASPSGHAACHTSTVAHLLDGLGIAYEAY